MIHEEEVLGRRYDHRLMRRLAAFLVPYRWRMLLAGLVVLTEALVGLAGPLLTKEAIDNGIRHRDLVHLDRVAVLYLCVLAAGFGLAYLGHQIMQRVGQQVMMDLRMTLFRHRQRLPISYYDKNPIWTSDPKITPYRDTVKRMQTNGFAGSLGYSSAATMSRRVACDRLRITESAACHAASRSTGESESSVVAST